VLSPPSNTDTQSVIVTAHRSGARSCRPIALAPCHLPEQTADSASKISKAATSCPLQTLPRRQQLSRNLTMSPSGCSAPQSRPPRSLQGPLCKEAENAHERAKKLKGNQGIRRTIVSCAGWEPSSCHHLLLPTQSVSVRPSFVSRTVRTTTAPRVIGAATQE
jgi:hypothetical protein